MRFDRIVSKLKAGKMLTEKELNAPLVLKGKTPVQMALQLAKVDRDKKSDFYTVAEQLIIAGANVGSFSLEDCRNLIGRHDDTNAEELEINIKVLLPTELYDRESMKLKIYLALKSRLNDCFSSGMDDAPVFAALGKLKSVIEFLGENYDAVVKVYQEQRAAQKATATAKYEEDAEQSYF